jgi:TonB family protein
MRELSLPFYRSRTSVAHPGTRLTLPQPSWAAVIVVTATVAGLTWGLMQQRLPDIDPRQVIAINLAAAKLAMEDERFVDPPERSALHYYSTVLALDATNADAIRGVEIIAAGYVEMAKQAIIEDRFADAVTAMDTIRRVQPNHARLVFLETELRKSLERRVFVLRAELAAAKANGANEQPAASHPTQANAARAEVGGSPVPAKAPPSNAPASAAQDLDRTILAAAHEQSGDTQAAGASTSELAQLVESLDREQQERERASTSDAVPNASAYTLIDAAYRSATRHMIEAPVMPADTISRRPTISPPVQAPAAASGPGASTAPSSAPASSVSSIDPKVVRWVPPKYPQSALVRGIEGWVDLLVVISPSGDVAEAIVQDRRGSRSFERAALIAARQWKYEPRAPGDTSVRDRVPVRVAFKLEE